MKRKRHYRIRQTQYGFTAERRGLFGWSNCMITYGPNYAREEKFDTAKEAEKALLLRLFPPAAIIVKEFTL